MLWWTCPDRQMWCSNRCRASRRGELVLMEYYSGKGASMSSCKQATATLLYRDKEWKNYSARAWLKDGSGSTEQIACDKLQQVDQRGAPSWKHSCSHKTFKACALNCLHHIMLQTVVWSTEQAGHKEGGASLQVARILIWEQYDGSELEYFYKWLTSSSTTALWHDSNYRWLGKEQCRTGRICSPPLLCWDFRCTNFPVLKVGQQVCWSTSFGNSLTTIGKTLTIIGSTFILFRKKSLNVTWYKYIFMLSNNY